MSPIRDDDDQPIPGLSGLREVTPPASLMPAVMERIAEPAPIPGLAGLREVTPPPALMSAVMRRVAQPAPLSFWERLWNRRPAPADRPIAGLAGLREVTPPPSLVPAVMRRVAEPGPMTFWAWLRKPRRLELRISPLSLTGMVGGVAMAMLVVWGMAGRDRSPFVVEVPAAPTTVPAASETPAVVVRFTLVAQGAKQVAVAGDFNGWDPESIQLINQDGQGKFTGSVKLPPGAHEYMFVVDGKWITDPAASELRPDGFGRTNAVLRL